MYNNHGGLPFWANNAITTGIIPFLFESLAYVNLLVEDTLDPTGALRVMFFLSKALPAGIESIVQPRMTCQQNVFWGVFC